MGFVTGLAVVAAGVSPAQAVTAPVGVARAGDDAPFAVAGGGRVLLGKPDGLYSVAPGMPPARLQSLPVVKRSDVFARGVHRSPSMMVGWRSYPAQPQTPRHPTPASSQTP